MCPILMMPKKASVFFNQPHILTQTQTHVVTQVTKNITDLSAAAFLKEVGKKTAVTARLSTVVHEAGCALLTSP